MKLFDMTVLPIGALRKAPWNYKTDDAEMAEKLRANMERNGQLENIVVRQIEGNTYEVVNGNHRYDAMTALGWTHATCLDLGEITTAKAKRIAIELNETRFESNPATLSEIMVGLVDEFGEGDILTTSPFGKETLDILTDPTLFMDQPPDPPDPGTPSTQGGGDGGASHPKLDAPFTFTLRFHEKNLIEWMSLLKKLREAYEVERNEEALLILTRNFAPTADGVEGWAKILATLPPGVFENLKAVETHISDTIKEDGRELPQDPHIRMGHVVEILVAEYLASYSL